MLRISVPPRIRRRERLSPGGPSVSHMQIVAELVPRRVERTVELRTGATGLDLLRSLGLPPDAHLLIRDDTPVPLDAPLQEGERIRVVGVVSGGGA